MLVNTLAALIKFDADDGAPSGGSNTGTNPDNDFVPKSDYDSLVKRLEKIEKGNNWAQSQVKTLTDERDSLKNEIAELRAGKKPKSKDEGDPEKEQLQHRLAEVERELQSKKASEKAERIKNTVRKNLGDIFRDNSFDYYWSAEGGNFEEKEIDGVTTVRHKAQPFAEWDEIKESVPALFRKPTKAPGTGVPGTSSGSIDAESLGPKLKAMSPQERQVFLTDPKNRAVLQELTEGLSFSELAGRTTRD